MTSRPVEAWDEVFVRARRSTVNAAVVDPSRWATWWPRTQVAPSTADSVTVTMTPRWPVPQTQRLQVRVARVRPRDKGVELEIDGDVRGRAEFFHLDEVDGVVVNWLLRAETDLRESRARMWLAGHRGWVRQGLTDLKRRLERGRTPGAEPHPALLAHQAREREVFAAEHAVYEVEQAMAVVRHRLGEPTA